MIGNAHSDSYCMCITVLCAFVCPASVLQAMAVLVCAEMYQVKRLQHLCEVCVCAYLQSMPSRELSSTGISVIRLLRRAKVSATFEDAREMDRENKTQLREMALPAKLIISL